MSARAIAGRAPLALVLATALFAFSRSLASDVGAVLAALALLGALLSVRLDPSLARLARLLSRVAVGAAVLAGWVLAVAPMLHGERADQVLRTLGIVLGLCAVPLAIARPRADAAVTLCAMGLLGVAGLHRLFAIGPYVFFAGFEFAMHAAIEVRRRAGARSTGSPARLVLAFAVGAAVAAGLATGLPRAQRRLEELVFHGRLRVLDVRTGLSTEDVRVGEIEQLARSERPVLRLYGPRAVRLRAQLYLHFDGRAWHAVHAHAATEARPTEAAPGPGAAPMLARMGGALRLFPRVDPTAVSAGDAIASRIEPIDFDDGVIVTPPDARAVQTEDDPHVDSLGLLTRSERRTPEPYAVVHGGRAEVGDPRPAEADVLAQGLALPRQVDARLRALAERLARPDGAPPDAPLLTARARIERTVAFVRGAARYSLETPRYTSRDVAAELIFDKRVGWCEHFASALGLLLRLEGVPTRYVAGYLVDESDRQGEHYLVRDENAHA